jgi:iron only hydrogenase large subunit-like protein
MGKLPEDFIEAMICEGGCVGGPSRHAAENEVRKARTKLLAGADKRGILENLKNYPMEDFSMVRGDMKKPE